jgi:MoxR-like ATPase
MQRPLLLEGEPGTGKTALAEAIAESLGLPLVRLQCYEGIDATQALYDWDFPRQILHLRALEAAGRGGKDEQSVEEAEKSLYDARFLLARPVLQALQESPAVLLVDEVDRADDEFEAFLLEVLSTYQVTIPELGTVRAATPPIVVLTSNRTRELHDALKRRCLYHWIDHPGLEREVEILRSRAPEVSDALRRQVVTIVQQLRARDDLQKPPGVAETLDWARALQYLGTADIDLESASATLGALVKYREDADRVRQALDRMLRT